MRGDFSVKMNVCAYFVVVYTDSIFFITTKLTEDTKIKRNFTAEAPASLKQCRGRRGGRRDKFFATNCSNSYE